MTLSTLDYLRIIIDILAISTSIGLTFAVLISPNRRKANFYFAIFAVILFIHASLLLIHTVPLGIPRIQGKFIPHLVASMLALLLMAYFQFVVYFVGRKAYHFRWIPFLAPLVVGISLLLIWGGYVFDNVSADGMDYDFTPVSFLVVGIAVGLILIAFRLVISTEKQYVKWLRVPTILMAIAYAMNGIIPTLPVDTVLFSIVVFWSASAIIRRQVFNPVQKLNNELQTKNAELLHNVNELAREKERVEQLNRELLDSNRYKDEFMANTSHELRTPLNSIIGYSELLMSPIYGQLNKQQKNRIERIYRNGINLSNLIDTILDMSKLESGNFMLDIEQFDIHTNLEEVLKKIRPLAEEKKIAIQTHIPQRLPDIKGDSQRIQQIIYNLLDNAVKFTQQGHIELHAQTINIQAGVSSTFQLPADGWLSDGQWLLIRISDTGIGIALDKLEHIFTNFIQLDGSRTRDFGGLGLGLPITKRLVELHSGMIWVESTPNVGSIFCVAIPTSLSK